METLHKRVAGFDVHRMKLVVTLLVEDERGQPIKDQREFAASNATSKPWPHGCGN